MARLFLVFVFMISFFSGVHFLHPVLLNSVIATVGNRSITLIDLDNEKEYFKKRKGIKLDRRDIDSQILDLLISRAIVDYVASEESITLPPERVESAIDREMQMRGFSDRASYEKRIERELGIPWDEYKNELTRQLKTQQVIQLKVSVPSPTMSQVREWYNNNRSKIGKKILFRMILKSYNSSNELQVSRTMKKAHSAARRNFAQAAKNYSEHYSKNRGGLIGPMRIDEIARMDQILAGALNNMRRKQISQVFVGQDGYYVVKVESLSPIPMDEVYDQIRGLLMAQNEQAAFGKWVKNQKTRISVKIFMDGYQRS